MAIFKEDGTLDAKATESQAGLRLQQRAVEEVLPQLAAGLAESSSAIGAAIGDSELFAAARSLLFQLLIAAYAAGKGRGAAGIGRRIALRFEKLARGVREVAGDAADRRDRRLRENFSDESRELSKQWQACRDLLPAELWLASEQPDASIAEAALSRCSDRVLAAALDHLLRDDATGQGTLALVDFASLDVRHLGAIHERLLHERLRSSPDAQQYVLKRDRTARKNSGSYYTPEVAVGYLVASAIEAGLREELRRCERSQRRRDFSFRVLEPAMGCGYFLTTALGFVTRRIAGDLQATPWHPLHKIMTPAANGQSPGTDLDQRVRRWVAEHCLWGMDLDPRAVEIARASIWLEAGTDVDAGVLRERLTCGNALLEFDHESPAAGGFDAVIGNPPYSGKLTPELKRQLVRRWPLMKSNSDTAVGFIELATSQTAPRGRVGLLLPKPLTYSYAWREVRRRLDRRVERIVDLSRAWDDVRLEQIAVVFRPDIQTRSYRCAVLDGGRIGPHRRIDWQLADRFETLPCVAAAADQDRLARLRYSGDSLGDVCRTFRGLPLQRQLKSAGGMAILGGRDLSRWAIRSTSGYLDPAGDVESDASVFAGEKLLFQNIIAHVMRPTPHLLLIGAYDGGGHVTLDTVNNLVPREPGLPLMGVLGLLHTRLVNWLIYTAVYNRAVRTMHFDQYFLNKIPLPPRGLVS